MPRYRVAIALLLLSAFTIGLTTGTLPAQAVSDDARIPELAQASGIAWVVDHFSRRINRVINGALREHHAQIEGATRVVPIMRVGLNGGGIAVGAAQVMGPPAQVEQVQAVAEVQLSIPGAVRSRGLIPVSSRDVGTIKGVSGVSVSANVKIPL